MDLRGRQFACLPEPVPHAWAGRLVPVTTRASDRRQTSIPDASSFWLALTIPHDKLERRREEQIQVHHLACRARPKSSRQVLFVLFSNSNSGGMSVASPDWARVCTRRPSPAARGPSPAHPLASPPLRSPDAQPSSRTGMELANCATSRPVSIEHDGRVASFKSRTKLVAAHLNLWRKNWQMRLEIHRPLAYYLI